MTVSSSAEGEPAWTRAIELERLRASGRATVKLGAKQLALFLHEGAVHACNNRCPHEGYPLVEGALDAESCVLTCHWHNWKFDLRTGANHYGGDSLRIYPVKVDAAGVVWVDARDAPAEERVQQALAQLDDAMADHDARVTPASLPVSIGPVPSPKWRLRVPSGAATSACATA